jgi:solute carrier family 25 citrate transporter 1
VEVQRLYTVYSFSALAGAVSVFVNNPIDVTKTQMQGLESSKYKNSFHCAKTILVTQGPMFFYRGVTPRLMRVCGDVAIQMTLYEKLVNMLSYLQG